MKFKEINRNSRMNKYLYEEDLINKKTSTLKLEDNDSSFQNIDLISKLLKMGYELDCLNRAYTKYKFRSIEEALLILNKDEEKDKFTHPYLEIKNKKNCGICNNPRDTHLDNITSEHKLDNSGIPLQCTTFLNNSNNNHLMTEYQSNHPLKPIVTPPISEKPIIKKLTNKKIQELEEDYKGKNLCLICFVSELYSENIFRKNTCGHRVCMTCMKTYLELKINESNVENIYCLHPGCKQVITDEEVRYCLDLQYYTKYKKFKRRLLYLKNTNKGFVPCPFPNCEEFVEIINGSNNAICDIGHSFCSKCMERCHQGDCSYSAIESLVRNNDKIKLCPCCKGLIEKSSDETCNHMTCICGYEFCWICLKEYNSYHFSFYNVTGCPGMRFSNPKKNYFKNPFIKLMWYLLSLICSLIVGAFVLCFFLLFGACYELLKCYIYGYNEEEVKNESSLFIYTNERLQDVRGNKNEFKPNVLIIFGIILCGLALQPFYLCFKIFVILMECYRNFGCWFYLYASH